MCYRFSVLKLGLLVLASMAPAGMAAIGPGSSLGGGLTGPQGQRPPSPPRQKQLVTLQDKSSAAKQEQLALADRLSDEAGTLFDMGKYAEAEKLDRKVLEIRLKVLGEQHADTAASCNNLGLDLFGQGKYPEAESLHRKALEIYLKALGEQHQSTAGACNNLADDLQAQGNYVEAEKLHRRGLGIFQKVVGEQHPHTASSYDSLALDLSGQGQPADAEKLHRKALAIFTKTLGAQDPETAKCCSNLAIALLAQRQYTEAETMHRRALDIYLKTLGAQHPESAKGYHNLGLVLYAQRRYAEAEKQHRKALDTFLKVLNPQHPLIAGIYDCLAFDLSAQGRKNEAEELHRKALDVRLMVLGEKVAAKDYSNLAHVLYVQGQYAEAERLFRTALDIKTKLLGEEHVETAASYANLGSAFYKQSQYAEAEKLHRKALEICLKILGEQHADTASACDNVALDLHAQGQYAEAENLSRRALGSRIKVFGQQHADTAKSYSKLALNLYAQGQYANAEKLHQKALEIHLKILGSQNTYTAYDYNNLALALHAQGQYAEAEHLYRKAVDVFLKVLGDQDADTASGYHNLALILSDQGRYAEAEKLYSKALEISLSALGEKHATTAGIYHNLALNLLGQGQFAAAEKISRKALEINSKTLGSAHPATALNHAAMAFALYSQGDYDKAENSASAAVSCFWKARLRVSFTGLGRSGFAAKYSPSVLLAVLMARNGKSVEAWNHLEENHARGLFDDLTARTARKLTAAERQRQESILGQLAGIDKQLAADRKINVKEFEILEILRDQLMAQLLEFQAQLVNQYGVAEGQVYQLDKIRAALPADAALISWVDMDGEPTAKDPDGEHWGVVVRPQGPPIWVKLSGSGPKGKWEKKDNDLPQELSKILHSPTPVDWSAWMADLAKQRLRPLEEHLKGVKHLIVLPSSALAGIPIEALTDRYLISYAPSATIYAWLQENRKDFKGATGSLLALADPIFSQEQAKLAAAKVDDWTEILRGKLNPLPGTRAEAGAIAKLFGTGQVKLMLGQDANSANLERLANDNQLANFRYLHLATHGQFDPKGGLNSYLCLTPEDLKLASFDKLSAGHMLRTWKLDADLVTLSACTTALGQYQGGEGYVGFSQALFLSGAHSVVLSQWSVNDLSTTLFMERFYQNMLGKRLGLAGPLPKLEALSEARQWLRALNRDGALKRLQEVGVPTKEATLPAGEQPFAHPYYWAPFILVGDPGSRKAAGKQ